MLTKLEDAIRATEETISYGLRSEDYEKNVEVARLSRIYMTGEGQDREFLMKLRDKETDRQKTIRVHVTKPVTPFALMPVRTEFEKIFRVDGIVKEVKNEDPERLARISEAVSKYHADQSLSRYLEKRYLHYQFFDPNAWHVTEFKRIDDESGLVRDIVPYPLEVSSEEAINYHYENGVPQWLIVRQGRFERVRSFDGEDITELVHDFYFYGIGLALKYTQYKLFEVPDGMERVDLLVKTDSGGTDSQTFTREVFETGSEEFPGQKFGSYPDADTDGNVMVPPYWQGARFLLDKLINMNSSFEVSVYNHVFPKLFHYTHTCEHSEYLQGEEIRCQSGFMGGIETRPCPKCNGTGSAIHVSESDVITFDIEPFLSDDGKIVDLSQLAHYISPPLAVTQELWNWLKEYRTWVYLAAFNTSNVEKPVNGMTATEVDKLWDEKNTRIYPAGAHLSRLYEKAVRVMGQYLESSEGLTVRHYFPPDMKLEPLGVLIDRVQRMKDAGVPYEAIWDAYCNILGKTMLDEPDKVDDIKAWEHFRPFKSMNQEDIALVLSVRSPQDFDRVLWENWDTVKRTVADFLGEEKFHDVPRAKQYELVAMAVGQARERAMYDETQPMELPGIETLTADP